MAESQTKGDIEPATRATHNDMPLKATDDVILKSSMDNLGYWASIKKFWKVVLVCNLLCIAAGCEGYQISITGNIIANQGFINHLGVPDDEGVYHLVGNHVALWGAMQSLGQFIGMVFLNPVSDKIGRKMTMYLLWVIVVAGTILESVIRDWRDWTGAKLLAGIGVGCIQSTLPIYVTEWAPANIRGAMILTYGFWNRIGSFLGPLVLTLVQDTDPLNYKIPILTQWGFVAVMLPVFLYIPETPAYHAERDEDEKGKASLRRIFGNVEGYDVEAEYAIIKNTTLEERRKSEDLGLVNMNWRQLIMSYIDCFRGPNLRRTLGSALPVCAQQLTGLSFLNTYASVFFRQSGFDNPFLITTIMTVIALATSICLILLSDRVGRRPIVFVSTIVCTITLMVVGILGFVPKTKALQNFLIFVACVWSFFNVALGALGWAFVGEIASQRLRARTAGLAAGTSVLFGLTFNTSVPILLDPLRANWGYSTAFLFFGTGCATCALVWLFVPEPSQRNAAELDEMFEKAVPAWRMRNYVTDVQKVHSAGRAQEKQDAVEGI